MTFLEKIKTPKFRKNVAKVAIPFFIAVTVISLLWNNWSDIFSGDFAKVSETNFDDGKWKTFWGMKFFVSFFYGIYITNKNMK